jgi:hypothetical protein
LIPLTVAGGGKLISLGLEMDSATRAVPLVQEVANSDAWLRIGQLVTLHVETTNAQHSLAIPGSALAEENGESDWHVTARCLTYSSSKTTT